MENQNPEKNLLTDVYQRPLEYATVGQRFLNHVIDLISFYLLFFMLTFAAIAVTGDEGIAASLENVNPLVDRLVTLLMFATYVGLVEGFSKGKTLGKIITRTRGVNEDGTPIDFTTGFLRGLSRAVPFEPFSAFGGYPWHDRWTKTRVVKEESLQH